MQIADISLLLNLLWLHHNVVVVVFLRHKRRLLVYILGFHARGIQSGQVFLVPDIFSVQAAQIAAGILVDLAGGVIILVFTTRTACLLVRVLASGRARFELCTENHRFYAILQLTIDLWRVYERCLDVYEISHVLGGCIESIFLVLMLTEALVHNQTILGNGSILSSSIALDLFGCLRLSVIAILCMNGHLDRSIMRADTTTLYRIIRLLMRLQS